MITGPITLNINGDLVKLSSRESQCLYFIVQCRTVKEIAKTLKLSHRTVESYINKLKNKAKVIYKADLALFAIESGLITLNFKGSAKVRKHRTKNII